MAGTTVIPTSPPHLGELPESERQRYIAQAAALGREAEQWKARALAAEAALERGRQPYKVDL